MFTAIVLDQASQEKLWQAAPIPDGWEVKCHHFTLAMGAPTTTDLNQRGAKFELFATQVGEIEGRVMAVKLGGKAGELTSNAIPHITLAVNREAGAKPFESNKISEWKTIEAIVLKGTLQICE